MCRCGTPAELLAACERFTAEQAADPDRPSVFEDVLALRRACDLLELHLSRTAAAVAKQEEIWEDTEGPLYWLRHECHMTGYAAAGALAVGDEVATLPESVEALRRGEIGFGHLSLIARTAAALRESARARGDQVPDDQPVLEERRLLAKARRHTVNRFRRDCTHLRHALDREAVLREHVELTEARSLDIAPRDDGCVELHGFLDPVGGAVLRTALAPLARRAGADDSRRFDRRQADALVELLMRGLDAGVLPLSGGARPHLQVTATLETLIGGAGAPAGEVEFGATIPTATVQRLGCDATVTRVVFGPESQIVDVGRGMRVPSAPTRRALQARDGGCVWPGCTRTVSFTHAHHLVHWARGGTTDVDNLVLLCHHHHWRVHEGGWQMARGESGGVMVVAPVQEQRGYSPGERSPMPA